MANQAGTFNVQEFADAGTPLVLGRLYTYSYGTTTQKVAYTDSAGVVPHTYTSDGAGGQYIALNSRGELPAPLYLASGPYDLALKRADGSSVWTRRADGQATASDVTNGLALYSDSGGSALIGFLQSGTGATSRTVQSKLRDWVSVKDFGATGDGTTDDTTTIQSAINSVSTGGALYFPPGTYKVSAALTITGSYLRILGGGNAVLQTNSATANVFTVTGNYVHMVGLQFTSSATRTAGYFVEFRASSFSRLQDFLMTGGATGVGITGAAATGTHIYNGSITGVTSGGNGVLVNGSANSSDIVMRDLWIVGASSVTQAASGVSIINSGDITLDHVSTVYAGNGLLVSPGASQTVQLLTVNQCEFDSGSGAGIQLSAAANGADIQAVRITNTWASSNASGGLLLTTTGTGTVRDVGVTSCLLSNNTGYGALINTVNVTNVRINNCSMSANSTAGFGAAVNATRFSVKGCTIGACGQFAGNVNGISLGSGCDNFEVTDNDLSNNTSAAMASASSVTLPGTPGQTYYIARNLGLVTYGANVVTLAAAATTTTVTHGLAATPRAQDIALTPRSGWGTAGNWSVNNPTATTFDIVTSANPGAGVSFSWQASVWGA